MTLEDGAETRCSWNTVSGERDAVVWSFLFMDMIREALFVLHAPPTSQFAALFQLTQISRPQKQR